MPRLLSALAALAVAALAGCSSLQRTDSFIGLITPYRIDIVQGNVVTKEQAALLKPGLTRTQVRDILGTPVLDDPFHADRWDYIFTLRRPGTQPQRRDVVVYFTDNLVSKVEAPELPTEREFVAAITRTRDPKVPKLELSAAERAALPVPPAPPASAAEPAGPLRDYPPLEAG